jgi:hypothetical protein
MRKVIVFLAVCGLVASAATWAFAQTPPARVKPDVTQQLAQIKPSSGTLTVNDFHIRFKGQIQKADETGVLKWLDAQLADVAQPQIYCSNPGAMKQLSVNDGWVQMNFTFPNTTLTPTQGMSFGFAVNGGINITDYECWWTLNGANVRNVPKVVPGAKVEQDKPKIPVKNLKDVAMAIQRKMGKSPTKPTMDELAGMVTLPDEELVDPTPINLPAFGQVEIEWPKPPLEPGVISRTYYTKTFYTADGTKMEYTEAFTIQVIPEPSTCLALAAGLFDFAGMIRRKR